MINLCNQRVAQYKKYVTHQTTQEFSYKLTDVSDIAFNIVLVGVYPVMPSTYMITCT